MVMLNVNVNPFPVDTVLLEAQTTTASQITTVN